MSKINNAKIKYTDKKKAISIIKNRHTCIKIIK